MKRQTFAILFFIKRTKLLKNGQTPVLARITVNGIRAEFQLKRTVNPTAWNADKERATGKDELTAELNRYLDEVRSALLTVQRELEQDGNEVTAEAVKRHYLGTGDAQRTILGMFDEHNAKMTALVGREFSQKTADRYDTTRRHLAEFIQSRYRRSDMEIGEIGHQFVADFDFFLQTTKGCIHNSSVKHLKALKKVVRIALVNRWIRRNPFEHYKLHEEPVEKDFLTQDELQRIMDKDLRIGRLETVRDVFVFCCYTGLSYIDVRNLKPEHLSTDNRGRTWIYKTRQKTRHMCRIPLLAPARAVLDKYRDHPDCQREGTLLPVASNQRLNSYLLEIADLCEVNKKVTMHVARHTFATTVTLSNGVSLESVSKMLGHDNLKSTQIYARITETKIGSEMDRLAEKLNGRI